LKQEPPRNRTDKNQYFHFSESFRPPAGLGQPHENPLPDGAHVSLLREPLRLEEHEKMERSLSTSSHPHSRQQTASLEVRETSSSKLAPHFLQEYSYKGTVYILHRPFFLKDSNVP
jgi:hypothetical protein